jgi:hypothetical protein
MTVNPVALLLFVGFVLLFALALSGGSATIHAVEAVVTVLILIGIGGFAFRGRQRSR